MREFELKTAQISDAAAGRDEMVGSGKIEVRCTDLEKDAERIAELFHQDSAIEHLSGVAPSATSGDLDIKKYAVKYPDFDVVIASKEGVMEAYGDSRVDKRGNSRTSLLVAVDKSSESLVGVVTVERPTGAGLTQASISRLVVDKEVRGRGIGKALLRSAKALCLLPREEGGHGQSGIRVGIIADVEGFEIPQSLFRGEGYRFVGELKDSCVGWDKRSKRFLFRNVLLVELSASAIKQDNVRGLRRRLPRQPK